MRYPYRHMPNADDADAKPRNAKLCVLCVFVVDFFLCVLLLRVLSLAVCTEFGCVRIRIRPEISQDD